jgi:Actin-like ATPase involved in cell division
MEERYIASVDLGTSKIAVCIARILDQNVQVIYYKETPSRGIRYSYVFNPKMVEDVIRGAISEAQQDLKI